MRFQSLLLVSLAGACATASPALISDDLAVPSWGEDERGILENHIQLTSSERFRKAGESYFSPDGKQIIFQAIEKKKNPKLEEAFYQMYVADLVVGGGRVRGIDNIKRLSPPGSSNTCGWFHPTEPGVVIFGSTLVPPRNPDRTGYQRNSSRYVWQFPQEMDIVRCEISRADGTAANLERLVADPDAYLAECVVAPDGRHMVFCEHEVEEGSSGGDLLILNFASGKRVVVTGSEGYDGGPFFSPDGKRLCYRSDRRGDDLLQIFVAELAFDAHGNVTGVEREFQLTDNVHVNWAPYWHPNGRYLVYATSQMGHENYEVFVVDADPGTDGGPTKYGTRRRRITHAEKFDGLPVFNNDASRMMWTCQRDAEGTSQVWLADFVMPLEQAGEASETVAQEEVSEEAEEADEEPSQVQDPDTGLYFLYDKAKREVSIYDPKTHTVRRDLSKEEIERAMQLFRRD
ncbi:MAG: hypothetical protein CMJ89_14200 [Planctomycetes bacterium]|nr:hypothetical protein [Planctomycetota bacterium]